MRSEELHDRRRAQILAAAADGFALKGIHQTTMQDICKASGLSAGALYRYFPTKDSIILALAEQDRADNAEIISYLSSGANIVAALTEIVPDLVDGLTDEKYGRLTLEVGAEATRNPSVKMAFDQNEAQFRDVLAEALRAGQEAGYVDPSVDRDTTVFLLTALLDGIAGRATFSRDLDKKRLAKGLEHLINRWLSNPAAR
ncbi:TetR/AcrR family transcriptional regulator [Dactylosporangium roseum]